MDITFPLSEGKVEAQNTTFLALYPEIQKVTIIGTGNVAHWLVYALKNAKISISQIFGRNEERCRILAESCGAEAITDLTNLKSDSDLYIFSLKDDSYGELISQVPFQLPMAVLTSGTLSQNVLSSVTSRFGTLYPCQTLSAGMDFSQVEVPLCVEGCDEEVKGWLLQFAKRISGNVQFMSEQQRQFLHLSAVFACNFTNAQYGIAFDILKKENIDPQILIPLLQNTLDKLKTMSPQEAQTGPAARNDKTVMDKQLELLENNDLKDIYQKISQYIMNHKPEK